jgi:ribosomal protein S18 acetylase RimI-like enzyme
VLPVNREKVTLIFTHVCLNFWSFTAVFSSRREDLLTKGGCESTGAESANARGPLDDWQVFLLRAKSRIIGVSGLYRQPGMPSNVCWLGWFEIRPQFRRQDFGSEAIHQLSAVARNLGSTQLWVYTGCDDDVARSLYIKLGFQLLGPASDYASGKTMKDSDIVLTLQLDFPTLK